MATECVFLNPLRRDGTSQRQRLARALDPGFVSVDERSLSDLANYCRRYARLLRYYTPSNIPGGNWVDLVEHDISLLIARIGERDVDAVREAFDTLLEAAESAAGSALPDAYARLFAPLFALAEDFDDWYRSAIEGLALNTTLRRLIGSVLADALRETLSHAARAADVGIPVETPDTSAFADIWGLSESLPDPQLFTAEDSPTDDEIRAAVRRLEDIHGRFFDALVFVVDKAPSYLQETLEDHPEHKPHMALLLAFLQLMEHARAHINGLTAAHLDFYYKRVLGLDLREQVPDQVHLIFELAKGFTSRKLAEDTPLKAGKDAAGNPLEYAMDGELVVNRALIDPDAGLKSVFVEKDPDTGVVRNIYAASDADSADGEGAPIEDEDGKWATFGGTNMPYARIGFAVASPMFLLAEGTRVVELKFSLVSADVLTGKSVAAAEAELKRNLIVEASGEKGWLPVSIDRVELGVGSEPIPYLLLSLKIGPELGPVVSYDEKTLAAGFETAWPVVRVLLDNDGLSAGALDLESAGELTLFSDAAARFPHLSLVRDERKIFRAKLNIAGTGLKPTKHPTLWEEIETSYAYRYFERIEIRDLDIAVDVDGVRTLVLENDVGRLDPAKPFHPFGPVPRSGGRFLVGSHEAFQKTLTSLDLRWSWADLPAESFVAHYAEFKIGNPPASPVTDNQYFEARLQVLQSGTWIPSPVAAQALFDGDAASAPSADKDMSLSGELGSFSRDTGLAPFEHFETGLRQGFVSLELATDFLHRHYPTLLAEAAIAGNTTTHPLPNQPYTPMISALSLDYVAQESVCYSSKSKDDYDARVEQLFQIGPFGQREIFPIAADADAGGVPIARKLVPELTVQLEGPGGTTSEAIAEGNLYIGIDRLDPPQNLSLLFQVAEGSEDPKAEAQEIHWSYLSDSGWIPFEAAEIVSDGTNGLLGSGVIKLAMPKTLTEAAGLLPNGLRWIRASVVESSEAVPKLISIQPQAAVASFRDQGNDPSHLETSLPAGTIAKLRSRDAAIKSVTQPYASFDGRMREADADFYIRVSERLRHKGRAVSIFDYERLVLEAFPEVYKVKCVNHTSDDSEYAPGHVRLVVVPNLRNKNAVDPLRPRLSLDKLEEVRRYLQGLASDFARIKVANPDYEEVQVSLKVRFQPGLDKGLYTSELEQDIIRFLSPWLYDDVSDLSLGGRIHGSAVLDYVQRRDYVDFVSSFVLYQVRENGLALAVDEAVASSSSSALVAAKTHDIDADLASCEDEIAERRTCGEAQEKASEAPTAPAAGAPAPVILPEGCQRFLGNTRSRELHDLLNRKTGCQIDEIPIDRRYYFSTTADAEELGYDYCAHCFSKGLSKR